MLSLWRRGRLAARQLIAVQRLDEKERKGGGGLPHPISVAVGALKHLSYAAHAFLLRDYPLHAGHESFPA